MKKNDTQCVKTHKTKLTPEGDWEEEEKTN